MTLLGVIVEHQNLLLQLYRKLEERFEENSVIRTLWRDMAGDVSLQIQSLKSFPPSLLNQFKNTRDNGFESAVKNVLSQPVDVTDISLRDGFEVSLRLTEPVVLKIYARLVRSLRKNSTAPALNFYILVKAYVARLVRTTESFAGDPMLNRRAQLLLLGFEKEVQEPALENKVLVSKPLSTKAQKDPVTAAKETTKNPSKNAKAAASKPKDAPAKKEKNMRNKSKLLMSAVAVFVMAIVCVGCGSQSPPVDESPSPDVIVDEAPDIDAIMSDNETAAIAILRTITSAQAAYSATNNGRYGTLTELVTNSYLDERFAVGGNISGYEIVTAGAALQGVANVDATAVFTDNVFGYIAQPITVGSTGRYCYGVGPDMVIRHINAATGLTKACQMPKCDGNNACDNGAPVGK